MASLKDAARLTNEIVDLANQLHTELTEGDVDFEKMVSLADQIGERCDNAASTFSTFNDALSTTLQGGRAQGAGNGGQEESGQQGPRGGGGSAQMQGSRSGDEGEREAEEEPAGDEQQRASAPVAAP